MDDELWMVNYNDLIDKCCNSSIWLPKTHLVHVVHRAGHAIELLLNDLDVLQRIPSRTPDDGMVCEKFTALSFALVNNLLLCKFGSSLAIQNEVDRINSTVRGHLFQCSVFNGTLIKKHATKSISADWQRAAAFTWNLCEQAIRGPTKDGSWYVPVLCAGKIHRIAVQQTTLLMGDSEYRLLDHQPAQIEAEWIMPMFHAKICPCLAVGYALDKSLQEAKLWKEQCASRTHF